MSKKIGIVICNYNKQAYIMACIQSVLESSFQNFDIFVVDNASTDDSVQLIREKYADQVTLIVNESNLGGSGGFNSGLRRALQGTYEYLMCVDNDIVMDPDNIEELYRFLEDNPKVGIAGSKICRMQHPERLQELGANLDFEKCIHVPLYKDYLDRDDLPEIQYCDYVPACSLMIRREVAEKIGILPEENFIYWDDMEWCYRAKLAGYQVAAYSRARVLHAMGTNSGTTYFSTYYFWRNRIRFFMKYAPVEKKENMAETLLENLFQTMYGCYYKGKMNQITSMMHAFDDAVHDCTGKAAEGKILAKDQIEPRIANLLSTHESIVIEFDGNYKLLQDLIKNIRSVRPDAALRIVSNDIGEVQKQNPEYPVMTAEQAHLETAAKMDTLWLAMCEHVSRVRDFSLQKIYIDPYSNLLENESDLQHFANYDYNKNLFVNMWKVLL